MKAIIETGGKQYLVSSGDEIFVEKLDVKENGTVKFDKVLMFDGIVGSPYVDGKVVTGKVLKHGKGKKIRIFKYKNKHKSTRRRQGHRQPYTKVQITKIG